MSLHVILGAGGSVSNYLVPILKENGEQIRLVSRSARQEKGVECIQASLLDAAATAKAVEGADVVYLLVGLPYNIKIWQKQWPVVMANVINACQLAHARLIFFDNVYMYGKVEGSMTESTPFNPCSKKGKLRAAIANQLLDAINNGSITALIARSADFYGPGSDKTGMANITIFANLAKHKKAQCLVNADTLHSFTYVPDAVRALYLLAKDPAAFNQTWHLPTKSPALTSKAFIELAANAWNQPSKYIVFPKWMVKALGLFVPEMNEIHEMLYQNEFPYLFNSSKFEEYFHFTPTTYDAGIEQCRNSYGK